MTIEALAMRFPSAERIVHSLVVDGMVERTTTSEGEAVELSPQGREFIKRRGTF